MDHGLWRRIATHNWRVSLIAGVLTAPVLAATMASSAYAAQTVPACSTAIQACGCQIKKKGTYNVSADLDASQGLTPEGDCIELKASRVTLHLNSHKITGPGGTSSDIGIDVRNGSNYDSIDGGSPDAVISGWNTGVADSGKNDSLAAIDASSNTLDGIEINHGNNDQITSWKAANNGAFGAWIKQGGGNSLSQGSVTSNGKAGLFVGCSAGGLSGEDCAAEGESKGNDLHNDSADSNGEYGVALDSNSADTTIDTVSGSSNGSDDLLDDSCNGDSFSGDSFGNSSNSCPGGIDS